MAADIEWTVDTAEYLSEALRTTLGRVSSGNVDNTAIAENWNKVQRWLDEVDEITRQPDAKIRLAHGLPRFPLSGEELRALQASVDRIAQARAAASPVRVIPNPLRLHESWAGVLSSSYPLMALLILSPAINAFNILVLHGSHEGALLIINGAAVVLGIGLWLRHRTQLANHKSLLNDIHPQAAI